MADCTDACLLEGVSLGMDRERYQGEWKKAHPGPEMVLVPIIFAENVRGLVPKEDLVVPHSENAMSTGAAGAELLAWTMSHDGHQAHVVYKNKDGCCVSAYGTAHELMSPALLRKHGELFGPPPGKPA